MADEIRVTIQDCSGEVKAEMKAAILRALEKCGLLAESHAKKLCPVSTGNLRNSITHRIDEGAQEAYIGTAVEYGVYVEMGTGKYVAGGRPTPWAYQDEKGNWHRTSGHKAQPFLKPAAQNHAAEYRSIVEAELKGE